MSQHKPYISPDTILPENTGRALLLGAVLSAVLAAANAYLGLFAGMTVSASIPAAVISMAILKVIGGSNILENNAVQTAASAGESLAAGIIFTFPALILMGYWEDFDYLQTMMIALCGGLLGVLFTIPLRSALIVKQKLQFPEGVATSEVLKSGEEGGKSVVYLLWAALIGAAMKFSEAGLGLWSGTLEKAAFLKSKAVAFFGINLSPALVAVGYIVGIRIAFLVFLGGVITWWLAIPIYLQYYGAETVIGGLVSSGALSAEAANNPSAVAGTLWSTKLRYLGVGAMVVGGLWALLSIRKALSSALTQAVASFKTSGDQVAKLRTEYDTPMSWVILAIGILIIPVFVIYLREIQDVGISAIMAIFMVVAGFLFSAVAGYMAGLVGSSNNPISGVTIATILSASLVLLALLGTDGGSGKGAAAAILIGAVVCCAAAIAGDNMQDLKSGHILGATPYLQQRMQFVGVIAAALVMPLVLNLLLKAYGIGPATEAMPKSLDAPQASLMASVATGVFERNLPWDLISVGAIIAVIVIILDLFQERRGSSFRLPVLAVAVGLYLPFELDSAIMLGGIIAWLVSRAQRPAAGNSAASGAGGYSPELLKSAKSSSERTGLLFASGLITGEALLGIFLAVPIVVSGRDDLFPLIKNFSLGSGVGLLILLTVCGILYYLAKQAFADKLK